MDPEACLLEALNHLADGKHEEAADALDAYKEFRKRGGFQPSIGGDKIAERIGDLLLLKQLGL